MRRDRAGGADAEQNREVREVERRAGNERHRFEIVERRQRADVAQGIPDAPEIVDEVGHERGDPGQARGHGAAAHRDAAASARPPQHHTIAPRPSASDRNRPDRWPLDGRRRAAREARPRSDCHQGEDRPHHDGHHDDGARDDGGAGDGSSQRQIVEARLHFTRRLGRDGDRQPEQRREHDGIKKPSATIPLNDMNASMRARPPRA